MDTLDKPTLTHMSEWKPWVCSISEARKCLGGISRTTFYIKILPQLEATGKAMGRPATVHMGTRHMIYKDVLHRLMEDLST